MESHLCGEKGEREGGGTERDVKKETQREREGEMKRSRHIERQRFTNNL